MSAAQLLRTAETLLVDFDGPLAALMPPPLNALAAEQVRTLLKGVTAPDEILQTTDHLAVLRWACDQLPMALASAVEEACTRVEVEAARTCSPNPHADDLLRLAERRGMAVAVVSNNSDRAVREFMRRLGWLNRVGAYACRTLETTGDLKPSPRLLLLAADALQIDITSAVFVGDSVSDVTAAKAAGCSVIGVGKNEVRVRELAEAGADAVAPLQADVTAWPGRR